MPIKEFEFEFGEIVFDNVIKEFANKKQDKLLFSYYFIQTLRESHCAMCYIFVETVGEN